MAYIRTGDPNTPFAVGHSHSYSNSELRAKHRPFNQPTCKVHKISTKRPAKRINALASKGIRSMMTMPRNGVWYKRIVYTDGRVTEFVVDNPAN